MHSNIRLAILFTIAGVGGLANALLALPATAGTNSWTEIGQFGLPLAFVVDPSSPSTIYGGNGRIVMKSTDGGGTWANLTSLGVDGEWVDSLVIDPRSPATIYAAMGPLWDLVDVPIYKSIDGGAHWAAEAAEFNGLPPAVVAIAPSLSSTLYAGGASVVFKSIDAGLSWAILSNGLTGQFVTALAIDPTNADSVYVAQQLAAPSGDPGPGTVFKSTDGGEHWRQVPISVPAEITSLAIDPSAPERIYAATDLGDIFKSIDSGETWIAARNGLPDPVYVHSLAIDPSTPARIYAATDQGIFMSADYAASWTPINSGLTNLDVFDLSIDQTGSLLRAMTLGGLFWYQVTGLPPSGTVPVIEYFYAAFDHYFITSNPEEIRELDNEGSTGWVRTGYQFNAYASPNGDSVPVCRFFSVAFAPKSSHFYTPFAAECAITQDYPAWTLESSEAFDIAVPAADGSCAAGLTPVYRLYNNGQGGAPNHRYTTDVAVRTQMISQGWVPEGLGPSGVEMCSPQ